MKSPSKPLAVIVFFLAVIPLQARNTPEPGELANAVAAGDASRVEELLARGADPDQADAGGQTPLGHAVSLGCCDLVERLLQTTADPDRPGRGNLTPLMLSVLESREDLMVRLLAAGADPDFITDAAFGDYPSDTPVSPLSLAINRGEYAMARRLLAAGADGSFLTVRGGRTPDPLGLPVLEIPLDGRIWADLADIADAAASPDWNAPGGPADLWALHRAARDDDWFTARDILDGGASPDAADDRGVTPMMTAAWNGNASLVSLFLQRGADPGIRDDAGRDALCYAAARDRITVIDRLLAAAGEDPGETYEDSASIRTSPVYFALISGRRAALGRLVDAGLPVKGRDGSPAAGSAGGGSGEGITLLMTAAWLGDYRALSLLLPASDGGAMDDSGRTALDWCAAAFDRDRRTGREAGDPGRGERHYPAARLLAARLRNPQVYGTQPTSDMHPDVIRSWSPGSDPVGADQWRMQRPSPVPAVPGDGDLTLYRIFRDEEPGTPAGG